MPRSRRTPQELSEIGRANATGPHERLWKRHPTGICGIPSCGGKHYMKDLCEMHYQRWRRTGSTGGLGRTKRQPKKTLAGHQPLIARPTKQPTKRAEAALNENGKTRVQRERARRVRKLAACVEAYGDRIKYTRLDGGGRIVYAASSVEILAEDVGISLLEAAGLLFDNKAGVLVLTDSGKEAISQWGLDSRRNAADGVVDSEPACPAGQPPMPSDHEEDRRGVS